MKRKVVVTGMGVVSCFGTDVENFYQKLLSGESGISPIDQFDVAEYPTRFAGAVRDFEIGDLIDKKQARRVDPFIRYAMVAGKKALTGVDLEGLDKTRCGILIGSGMGGMQVFETGCETRVLKGFKRITPFFVPFIITNMGGALLSIDLGFTGPNYSISTACATGTYALISAANHIQRGDADLMLAGGAEAAINPIGLSGFVACRALSQNNDDYKHASKPWDKGRDGFVMGEGAGVILLEEEEHAKARGATILGEYLGGATSADASHMTDPRPDGSGVAQCMKAALSDANLDVSDIDYINAHATSTLVGDLCEMRGVRSVFGDHAKNLAINATKSMTGHCLGAAGGIEAIAVMKALETGVLHPTMHVTDAEDEVADLNLVLGEKQELNPKIAMSNSFGFGGHNSSVIFGKR